MIKNTAGNDPGHNYDITYDINQAPPYVLSHGHAASSGERGWVHNLGIYTDGV